ncbi:unnamed protein product [Tilletia controversa]|uniref:Beta-fructofuranosidase n=3 Tax=Tilletia TaxID=13289 RepID=A0A8X7MWE9_9BASI|nr:hypothetical protein CF336_g3912 [Tilletia laevis]KAE8201296.1 hypothetical protein CF328_g2711 [Tilletia controversa]KAE8261453.1 hypothetical protein A4X03_0g3242 [Tilletia caries]KAE8203245.1 hypothetical protein CF335_g3103 [Tilletia laevis]KAE8250091.1 hypothetical protein A4X06_0g2926 [Tilletia controversa]
MQISSALVGLLLNTFPAWGSSSAKQSTAHPSESYAASTPSWLPDFARLPPTNFHSLANGSLFSQWRPKAHFIHPSQITGDPTSLWADPSGSGAIISTIYGYLRTSSNPFANALRAAKTIDFVTFEDWGVTIGPGGVNDPIAVFDGKAIPKGYKGLPTLLYTAVSYAPISWRVPYVRGAETQALAYSEDQGKTWIKVAAPPVIRSPPTGVSVTGFRDPYLFQSSSLDRALGLKDNVGQQWYTTVSSGEKGKGSRIFLYKQENKNWMNWTYIGAPLAPRPNTTFGEFAFTGNDGVNFECVTPLTLGQKGDDPNGLAVFTMGAEGNKSDHSWQLWKLGEWKQASPVRFEVHATGALDWAAGYACTGVEDYKGGRRIFTCMFTEDFVTDGKYKQNWQNSLTLSREVFIKELVVPDNALARKRASWAIKLSNGSTVPADSPAVPKSSNGTLTLVTLGQRPVNELYDMRNKATSSWKESDTQLSLKTAKRAPGAQVKRDAHGEYVFVPFAQSPTSRHWEMEATLNFNPKALRNAKVADFAAGITLMSGRNESAMLSYQPSNESVAVTRKLALSSKLIIKKPQYGTLRLWNTTSDNGTSFATQSLNVRVFMDGSALEIYINDLFVLSTRLYYWYPDSTKMGFFYRLPAGAVANASNDLFDVSWSNVSVWEGLFDAYPNRSKDPVDLGVYDTPIGFPQPTANPNGPLRYDDSYDIPSGVGRSRWHFQTWNGA